LAADDDVILSPMDSLTNGATVRKVQPQPEKPATKP
jgi:hypothetical protein